MPRGRKPIVLINNIKEEFCELWFGRDDFNIWPLWIDDILSGVTRLDWYGEREQQVPLSMSKLIKIFTTLDEISTATVVELLGVSNRMASKYAQAARIAYPLLKKSIDNPSIQSVRYPQVSIVSYEHGISRGYGRENINWEEENDNSQG